MRPEDGQCGPDPTGTRLRSTAPRVDAGLELFADPSDRMAIGQGGAIHRQMRPGSGDSPRRWWTARHLFAEGTTGARCAGRARSPRRIDHPAWGSAAPAAPFAWNCGGPGPDRTAGDARPIVDVAGRDAQASPASRTTCPPSGCTGESSCRRGTRWTGRRPDGTDARSHQAPQAAISSCLRMPAASAPGLISEAPASAAASPAAHVVHAAHAPLLRAATVSIASPRIIRPCA